MEQTTRHLIIMRHASAINGSPDIERSLSPQGRREALARGAEFIQKKLPIPEKILCSPARRTQETCQLFLEGSGLNKGAPTLVEEFYNSNVEQVCEWAQELDTSCNSVLILGHNPTWSQLIGFLTGDWPILAPSEIAVLEAPQHLGWQELFNGQKWQVKAFLQAHDDS